jgi:hypothetical protein
MTINGKFVGVQDYFGLCPRCCREPVRRDIETSHFICCDTLMRGLQPPTALVFGDDCTQNVPKNIRLRYMYL